MFNGVTSILVWTSFPVIVSIISLKSKIFRNIVEGKSTTFIQDGKILEENLKKEKYTADELLEQLRKKDVFHLEEVEFAMLETNGELSVLLKKENQPVRWKDLYGNGPSIKAPHTIIMDGNFMEEAIYQAGYSIAWVKGQLENHHTKVEEVFIGQVDSDKRVYFDYFKDRVKENAHRRV